MNQKQNFLGETIAASNLTEYGTKKVSNKEDDLYESFKTIGLHPERNQYVGDYNVDFLFRGILIVDVEGPYHGKDREGIKTEYFEKLGYPRLRFSDETVGADSTGVAKIVKDELVRLKKLNALRLRQQRALENF